MALKARVKVTQVMLVNQPAQQQLGIGAPPQLPATEEKVTVVATAPGISLSILYPLYDAPLPGKILTVTVESELEEGNELQRVATNTE